MLHIEHFKHKHHARVSANSKVQRIGMQTYFATPLALKHGKMAPK